MSSRDSVRVVFVDADTEQEFARADLDPGQLPESFELATRLELEGQPWSVVRAEPPTAAEFLASGSLVLTLRRIRLGRMDPRKIKYTLPTFFNPLPPSRGTTGTGRASVLHEDDWRRIELVSRRFADEVEAELRVIRRIHQRSRVVGEGASSMRVFDELHIRESPTAPLGTGVPRRRLFDLLPVGDGPYAGVRIRDIDEHVVDSFAVTVGPTTLYGQAPGDRVTVLCLDALLPGVSPELAAGLQQVMREFDLVLVDWCNALSLDADGLADLVAG